MKFMNVTKLGAIAAVLIAAVSAAAPAGADTYRGYFGDRDGASMRIVVRDNHRDFDRRHDMWQRDAFFFHHARFHPHGWDWQHRDREFRY